MSKHYYFKFGKGNEQFSTLLQAKGGKLKKGDTRIPLAIYFNDLTAKQYKDLKPIKKEKDRVKRFNESLKDIRRNTKEFLKNTKELESSRSKWSIRYLNKTSIDHLKNINTNTQENQIRIFNTVKKGDKFYLFYERDFYVFESLGGEMESLEDGHLKWLQNEKELDSLYEEGETISVPKCRRFKLVKTLIKNEVPNFFFRIHTNQKYNRKTIVELNNSELDIAKTIESGIPIEICKNNFLNYLSPIQFKSMLSLMFLMEGYYLGTDRGRSASGIDLLVHDKEGDLKGKYQIKYSSNPNKSCIKKDITLICLMSNIDLEIESKHNSKAKEQIWPKDKVRQKTHKLMNSHQQFHIWILNLFRPYKNLFNIEKLKNLQ